LTCFRLGILTLHSTECCTLSSAVAERRKKGKGAGRRDKGRFGTKSARTSEYKANLEKKGREIRESESGRNEKSQKDVGLGMRQMNDEKRPPRLLMHRKENGSEVGKVGKSHATSRKAEWSSDTAGEGGEKRLGKQHRT